MPSIAIKAPMATPVNVPATADLFDQNLEVEAERASDLFEDVGVETDEVEAGDVMSGPMMEKFDEATVSVAENGKGAGVTEIDRDVVTE
jgi:hypothetical protein